MKKLGIIGSGDLGQLIAYHTTEGEKYKVTAFFDDFKKKDELIAGIPVVGGTTDVINAFNDGIFEELIVGIGYKHIEFRKEIYETFSPKIPMANIIHSSSYIDPSCKLGSGIFMLPGCVLDRNVEIKDNVLLNTGCVIAHDSVIGSHTFLSPAVNVAGFVRIEECCNIGINSTIIDNVQIISKAQTGGGTVVIKDITESGLYVGNPARKVR